MKKILYLLILILLTIESIAFTTSKKTVDDDRILSYTVDPKTQDLQLYWKNDKGELLKSIQNLKNYVESKNLTLLFCMNVGMYKDDFSPLGLFTQKQKTLSRLNTSDGEGNFHLKPNGVFYITTDNLPVRM